VTTPAKKNRTSKIVKIAIIIALMLCLLAGSFAFGFKFKIIEQRLGGFSNLIHVLPHYVILRLKAEESLFKSAASCGELTRRD